MDLHGFKDICICALRYSLGRHTYVVQEVCEFIINNADIIIDDRVKTVMLRDIKGRLDEFRETEKVYDVLTFNEQLDYDTILNLEEFLINYEIHTNETNKD